MPTPRPADVLATLNQRELTEHEFDLMHDHARPLSGVWTDWKALPHLAYRESPTSYSGNVHNGQLKLLLSEIQFLTMCQRRLGAAFTEHLIVYAGSADGSHIAELVLLFPNSRFELWDPRSWSPILLGCEAAKAGRVTFNQAYFKLEDAVARADQKILFISDVRCSPEREGGAKKDASYMAEKFALKNEDHELQKQWVEAMKPTFTSLKFSPQYNEGKFMYFEGEIYVQAFMGIISTESRLVFEGVPGLKEYDCLDVEEVAHYHNIVTRATYLRPDEALGGKVGNNQLTVKHPVEAEYLCLSGGIMRYDDWLALNIVRDYLMMRLDGKLGGLTWVELTTQAMRLMTRFQRALGDQRNKFTARLTTRMKEINGNGEENLDPDEC